MNFCNLSAYYSRYHSLFKKYTLSSNSQILAENELSVWDLWVRGSEFGETKCNNVEYQKSQAKHASLKETQRNQFTHASVFHNETILGRYVFHSFLIGFQYGAIHKYSIHIRIPSWSDSNRWEGLYSVERVRTMKYAGWFFHSFSTKTQPFELNPVAFEREWFLLQSFIYKVILFGLWRKPDRNSCRILFRDIEFLKVLQ